MTIKDEQLLGLFVTIMIVIAGGGAVFVRMSVTSSLDKFRVALMRDMDERFMKRGECLQLETSRREMETVQRNRTSAEIQGIKVEVEKDKGDLRIILRDILAAIESPRRK